MKVTIHLALSFLFFAGLQGAFAQKKDENIGTEVVNVVKPYTPTISDAFKVKETPPVEDEDNTKKTDVKYNIFSFPVASTFTPSKGRAASVEKTAKERLFSNFATVAVGNYGTANAELFITENIGETGYIGGMFRHLSSDGGIEEARLEDSFNNSSIDLTYGNKRDDFSFNIDLGYQNQGYNWYGIPDDLGAMLAEEVRNDMISSIEPQHLYHNFYAGGKIGFNESFVNEVSLKYNRFWDSYGSQENRAFIRPDFSFNISDTKIKTNVLVDYISGSFEKDVIFGDQKKYGFLNIGILPSFNMVRDAWSITIGAATFFSMDNENSDNNLYIYPNVNASLNLVNDLMIFYAGAEGTLQQNSYRDFTNENPYLSPNLDIAPTNRPYDIFAGLKGRLASSVSYNIRASYMNEQDRALFRSNPYNELTADENYEFGNSFGVVYDDLKTISFFGELKADFSKNVSFGINGSYSSFTVASDQEAWNLPSLRAGASLDVDITPKWYAGTNVFYIGERKDARLSLNPSIENRTITLDPYFDANAHVGYKHNDRLTGFVRFNNIANQLYEKWLDYPVQGFQVMLGASYKFNF